jgi:ribosomal protein S6
MCLLDNREVRKGWQPLKDAVTGIFTKHGAKILSSRRWDERRLAYAIRGQQRGTYLLIYFAADTQSLTAIRRDLQFNESVLRDLLVDCAEVPQTAYEPEAAFDEHAHQRRQPVHPEQLGVRPRQDRQPGALHRPQGGQAGEEPGPAGRRVPDG